MDCLPKAAGALTDQIDSAKSQMDGLIGDPTAEVSSLIAGVTADIEAKQAELVPEIELPQANLQDEISSMLGDVDNPGKLATKFAEIKEKFVGLDLDSVMDGIGLDADALNSLDTQLKDGIATLNEKFADPLAGGFEKAIDSVVGGVGNIAKDGFSVGSISDTICKSVPNVDLDKDGNLIKKGLPSELPTIDAEKIAEAAKVKSESIIPESIKAVDLTENVSIAIKRVGDK